MTNTAVAAQIHQALDAHRDFTTQIAFNGVSADLGSEFFQHLFRQITDLLGLFDTGSRTDLLRTCAADAIDIGQAYDGMLVRWNINSCYSSHLDSRLSAAKRAILAINWFQINQFNLAVNPGRKPVSPGVVYGVDRCKSREQRHGA